MRKTDNDLCYDYVILKRGKTVDYIINDDTLALEGINYSSTKVIERSREFVVHKFWQDILQDSCLYYGASLQGRIEASRDILQKGYKVPIVVSELHKLVLFSLGKQTDCECMWISLKNICSYSVEKGNIHFYFDSEKELIIRIGKETFEAQILKAYNLEKFCFSR